MDANSTDKTQQILTCRCIVKYQTNVYGTVWWWSISQAELCEAISACNVLVFCLCLKVAPLIAPLRWANISMSSALPGTERQKTLGQPECMSVENVRNTVAYWC